MKVGGRYIVTERFLIFNTLPSRGEGEGGNGQVKTSNTKMIWCMAFGATNRSWSSQRADGRNIGVTWLMKTMVATIDLVHVVRGDKSY